MIRAHYVPLYQSICTSEKLADLRDDSARLFYVLLLTHCDAWGRLKAAPRVLNAVVWPMLGKTPKDVEKAMQDLERVGLIARYEDAGQPYLAVPDWEDKAGTIGKDRRADSKLPAPPDNSVNPRSTPAIPGVLRESQEYSSLARAGEAKPSQEEKSQEREENARKRATAADAASIAIPASLDTPEFQAAWTDWIRYRSEMGSKFELKPTGASQLLAKCAGMGRARATAALRHTMAMGWQGMREPDDAPVQTTAATGPAPFVLTPDAVRAERAARAAIVQAEREAKGKTGTTR